jgi:hypothetical protein
MHDHLWLSHRFSLAIVRTSRQLYHGAMDVFYGRPSQVIYTQVYGTLKSRWLGPGPEEQTIGPAMGRAIRNLHVELYVDLGKSMSESDSRGTSTSELAAIKRGAMDAQLRYTKQGIEQVRNLLGCPPLEPSNLQSSAPKSLQAIASKCTASLSYSKADLAFLLDDFRAMRPRRSFRVVQTRK